MKIAALAFIWIIKTSITVGQRNAFMDAIDFRATDSQYYQYDTDNNLVDLDKEFKDYLEPIVYTNVSFRYFKNQKFDWVSNPEHIMNFRVQYEFMVQARVDEENDLTFPFKFNKETDKVNSIKLTRYRHEKGKYKTSKVSKDDFQVTQEEKWLVIKPVKSVIKTGEIMRVVVSIESSDFELPYLTFTNQIKGAKYHLDFNKPDGFNYLLNLTNFELKEKIEKKMTLVKLTYTSTRLVTEYLTIPTTTYRLKVKEDFMNSEILFPLTSIELPQHVGITPDDLLDKGK